MGNNIAYSIQENRRLKHPRLIVTPLGEVVVAIPPGFDRGIIPGLVRQKVAWIAEALRRRQGTLGRERKRQELLFPDKVELRSVGEVWGVEYAHKPGRLLELEVVDKTELRISGDLDSHAASGRLLCEWLKWKAREELPRWLQRVARQHGFSYERVSIRHQKTRWGSCSGRGTISLNIKLLCLPPELVEHVLVHELCHTVHPNHSAAFWELVGSCDSSVAMHRSELRLASRYIPPFLEL